MTSAATYSDSLEAWQEALSGAEPTHAHFWLHATTQHGIKVHHCGCGERRITNDSPESAASAIRPGGSIDNCLFSVDKLSPS